MQVTTITIEQKHDVDGHAWFWHTVTEYDAIDEMTGQPIGEATVTAIDLDTCEVLS